MRTDRPSFVKKLVDTAGVKFTAATIQRRNVSYKPFENEPLLSTVYDVEICATGIEYPLASGPATFTTEDLEAAIAAQDDPAIQSPRVWLGHPDDDRFHAGRATDVGSAEPSLGTIQDTRIEDNGQVLVGNIVGCPTWLAKILASAYPSRSIEGYKDAETVTGRTHKMVITDLALLGVKWPGVSTLADLQALYSEEGPEGIEIEEEDPMQIAAARGVQAQADLDQIRRAFVAALPDLKIPGWPWIRSVLSDPNELIVDDDEGGLYAVTFDASDESNVSFGEPVAKKIAYVNASQAKDPSARGLLVNYFTNDRKVVASWNTRAESRPNITEQEDPDVYTPEQIQILRERLSLTEDQLPNDATKEMVDAALFGVPQVVSPPSATPSPVSTGEGAGQSGTVPAEPEPVAASTAPQLPPGMIAVPAEQWQEVQRQTQAIAASNARDQAASDLRLVGDALKAGKIFPYQRPYYESKMKDPNTRESFVHLLTASVEQGGLMPGVVPIEARGADPADSDLNQEVYPASWLPEVHGQPSDGASAITVEK